MSQKENPPAAGDAADGTSQDDQFSTITCEDSPNESREQVGDAVFFDDALVGHVFSTRSGFDAVQASGCPLGRFNTQTAAVRALIARSAP